MQSADGREPSMPGTWQGQTPNGRLNHRRMESPHDCDVVYWDHEPTPN